MPRGIYKHGNLTEEHKNKISLANKGKVRIVGTNKGIKNPFYGKHHTEASKLKISENSNNWLKGKNLSIEIKNKISKKLMGHKHSNETKEKIRKKLMGKYRGNESPHWRGGISETYKQRFAKRGWAKIRYYIFKRDNYTCKICGKTKCRIHTHHIVPYRISQDDSMENLITLCASCHMREERKYYENKSESFWRRPILEKL